MPSLRSRMLRRRSERGRGESGAAIVEFAIVVGLFMMLLYGFIAFGMAVSLKQRVTNAAAAGARSAIGAPDAKAAARATAANAMGGCTGTCTITGKQVPLDPNPTVAACAAPDTGTCITVTVTAVPVLQDGIGLAVPDSVKSTAVVKIS